MVRAREYRLYNINNLKLARFKEIFPGAAKTDVIDARKGLELFQLSDHLPLAKGVLQEVWGTPEGNEKLKCLTRRRRQLVRERGRVLSSLQVDLQAVCPGLLEITKDAGNQWFLRFLTSVKTLRQFYATQGGALMPGQKDALSPKETWDLVNYLGQLQKAGKGQNPDLDSDFWCAVTPSAHGGALVDFVLICRVMPNPLIFTLLSCKK
jgi:hypothetical protein